MFRLLKFNQYFRVQHLNPIHDFIFKELIVLLIAQVKDYQVRLVGTQSVSSCLWKLC